MSTDREETVAEEAQRIRAEAAEENAALSQEMWRNVERRVILAWAKAHREDRQRAKESREELRTAVRRAVNSGMTEVETAKLAGVTRMTVRAWLGK
jgi:DNA invertase Pin-like site-specific DNA recombinase